MDYSYLNPASAAMAFGGGGGSGTCNLDSMSAAAAAAVAADSFYGDIHAGAGSPYRCYGSAITRYQQAASNSPGAGGGGSVPSPPSHCGNSTTSSGGGELGHISSCGSGNSDVGSARPSSSPASASATAAAAAAAAVAADHRASAMFAATSININCEYSSDCDLTEKGHPSDLLLSN
jgi:hypothetical protein